MKRIGAMAAVALIALLIALPLGLVAAQGDAPRANVPPAFIFRQRDGRRPSRA